MRLEGIVPPVCTPLTEEREVDTRSLERLLRFLIDGGVNGLFVLGSTSEAAFLTNAQRRRVMDVAVRTVAGGVPVVAGVIDMTTGRCLEHAAEAQRAGVDGLVATAPFYTRSSQTEILAHFRAIHAATTLPLLAYDIPVAVQTKLELPTLVALAQEGTICGVKDSSGSEADFRALVLAQHALPGFSVFTGSELLVDVAVYVGASGAVPGLGNVDPAGYARVFRAAQAGDWQTARTEQERLFRLFSIVRVGLSRPMSAGSSAIGAFKTALMLRGIIATNAVCLPQTRLDQDEVACVREALVAAGLLL